MGAHEVTDHYFILYYLSPTIASWRASKLDTKFSALEQGKVDMEDDAGHWYSTVSDIQEMRRFCSA